MRDLRELGLNSGGAPVGVPAPTTSQLAFVERLIGARLPREYVEFLNFSNGGSPETNAVYIDVDGRRELWDINDFFHIAADSESTQDTEDVVWNHGIFQRYSNLRSRAILPIAQDGGGDFYCLDLRPEHPGGVVLWIHDEPGHPLVKVADSFSAFVDALLPYPDDL